MRFISPLRYPGGKGALGHFVGELIAACRPLPTTYVEPFAGGGGVALRLLYDEYVETIILNDLDPGVAAFWRTVFNCPDELIDRINDADISIEAWHSHRATYEAGEGDDLTLGFATFFLNRTNRSGILGARPIGGLRQTGKWGMSARFNREDLTKRIRTISRYRNRVELREQHATDFIEEIADQWDRLFVYADPPYLGHGASLYLDAMNWEDHRTLAEQLTDLGGRWMVTYDADERILTDLYSSHRCAEYGIAHSAGAQHMGKEYVVFSDTLPVEEMTGVGSGSALWLRGKAVG